MHHLNQPITAIPDHLAGDEQVIVYVQGGVATVKVSDEPLRFLGRLERKEGDDLTVVFAESLSSEAAPHVHDIVSNVGKVEELGRQAILQALLQKIPSSMAA